MISKAQECNSTKPLEALTGRQGKALQSHDLLLRDSLGYLMSKVVPGFFGLISVPIFVRLIGIEGYGRLSVILPILLALVGAGSGWLQQSMLRFHPSAEDSSGGTESPFHRAVLYGTVLAVLGLALVLLPILVGLHYPWKVRGIAEAYCAFQLIYLVHLTRLQARLQPRAVLMNEALRSSAGFFLPIALVLVAGRRSFSLVLLGLALAYVLPLFTGWGRIRSPVGIARLGRDHPRDQGSTPRILKELWRFGWAVALWLMLCQAMPIVGRSAIERYSGYAQAGVYASLYELAVRSFSLFASPVTQAAHPRIMRAWNLGDYTAARRTIGHAIRMQVLMFIPVEVIGIVFAGRLTRLALGAGTPVPGYLLPLLMLGGFLWQIALLVHKPLEIMQRTKTMLCAILIVLLIELAGNYLLVPKFGMKAAVIVFVAGALAYIALVASHGVLFWAQSQKAEA
jgi:O-antigen/teichoic acid export membrane protein